MESQKRFTPTYSLEFFPPKSDEGLEKLRTAYVELAKLNPEYISVTFGAGGSTQERTFETVMEIQGKGTPAAPHLSCVGSTKERVSEILENYRQQGIRRIVALRGDLPSGMVEPGEFRYANELVSFIRETTGDHFTIEVAAYPEFHPQANNSNHDLDNFQRKVEAGANAAITQYFFNADAYFRFVADCERRGIDIPIVPGIMPITNYSQLARFSDMCGAEIPRWIRKRLESLGDDRNAIRAFGLEVITDLCRQLLAGGAPGLHFYTMNQAKPTSQIWHNLNLGTAN